MGRNVPYIVLFCLRMIYHCAALICCSGLASLFLIQKYN